jgi:hypothetical protein
MRARRWVRKWSHDLEADGFSPLPRVYGIDPNAHRNPVPPDYVSKLRAAYVDEGPTPSLTQYGWVLGS